MATESGGCSSCGTPVTDGGQRAMSRSGVAAAVESDCGHTVTVSESGGGTGPGGGIGSFLNLRTLAVVGVGVGSGTVAVVTR